MATLQSKLAAKPLYIQVRDVILARVAEGLLRPGEPLPNEISLAQQLGTSIGTVRKALLLLEEQSIIVRRQGRGTFVRDFSKQPLMLSSVVDQHGRALADTARATSLKTIAADTKIADRLKLAVGEEVLAITRVRTRGQRTYMVEESWLPARRFPSLPEDVATTDLPSLAQMNLIIVGHGSEKVRAIGASGDMAQELGVVEGTPILALDRIVLSADGYPLEWRLGFCHLLLEQFIVRYE